MRNLKGPTHMQPLVQNSFKKSSRPIIQPQQVSFNQRNQMDQEYQPRRQVIKRTKQKYQYEQYQPKKRFKQKSEQIIRYSFLAGLPFPIHDRNSNIQYIDKTCLWFKNIQKNPESAYFFIKIHKISFVLSNWGDDKFPQVYYLCIDGMNGICDTQGVVTDRVACLELQQIEAVMNQQDIRTYQIRYLMKQSITWEIPPGLTHIKMSIKKDNDKQAQQLPLHNQILLNFQFIQN